MNTKSPNKNSLETNDHNEILTLIDLLVLRVECLANESKLKKKKKSTDIHHPTIAEIDQNLIEYLYYLFTKFINENSNFSNDSNSPMIDKNHFVNVCQTLVRDGCFDMSSSVNTPTSPNHLPSAATSTSDHILAQQTIVGEYLSDTNEIVRETLLTNEQDPSLISTEEETWLVVDLKSTQSKETAEATESKVSLDFFPKKTSSRITLAQKIV